MLFRLTARASTLVCIALIGLGLIISAYLLERTFHLITDRLPDEIDPCSVVFGVGCNETLLSPTSWQVGIPLAGWGVVYYATLACLMILGRVLGSDFELEATLGALLLAVAGACASLMLAMVLLLGWAPLCPLCLVIHAVNLALVPALKGHTGRTARELLGGLQEAARYVLVGNSKAPSQARWKVVGFTAAGLMAIVIYQWVLVQSERRVAAASRFDPTKVRTEYASAPKQGIPVDREAPRLGPEGAPVQLIVLSSFQCPGCRAFSRVMRQLADLYDEDLVIRFKHYPMGTPCSEVLRSSRSSPACESAWSAEAARRQGRFWAFHDALFAADRPSSEELLLKIAGETGLDMGRFQAQQHDPTTVARVDSDIELGSRLGVDVTPAVFINGRRVRQLSRRALEVVIEYELDTQDL